MGNNIEEAIFDEVLPVNTIPMINRLKELLKEHDTNCLEDEAVRDDIRVQKLMWLINSKMYGQMSTVDLVGIWDELNYRNDCEVKK